MSKTTFTQLTIDELNQLIQNGVKAALQEESQKENNTEKDEFLTVDEAAKFLRVTNVTIHNYKKKNGLPYHKIGRGTRFKKSELLAFISRKEHKRA